MKPNEILIAARAKALELMVKGRESMKSSLYPSDTIKGYELFKQGLDLMKKYEAQEPNAQVRKDLRPYLIKWDIELLDYEKNIAKLKPSPINKNRSMSSAKEESKSSRKQTYDCLENNINPSTGDLSKFKIRDKPCLSWKELIAPDQIKKNFEDAVIVPLRFSQVMKTKSKNILLFGPAGNGKNSLARALISELSTNAFYIPAKDSISFANKGNLKGIIKEISKISQQEDNKTIIFIDDINQILTGQDAILSKTAKTDILMLIQEIPCIVIAVSSMPWNLDSTICNSFGIKINVPLPDFSSRELFLSTEISRVSNSLSSTDIEYLSTISEGYSFSDLVIWIRDASMYPIRQAKEATYFKPVGNNLKGNPVYEPCSPYDAKAFEKKFDELGRDQVSIPKVSRGDFESALNQMTPSISIEERKRFEKWIASLK